MSEIPPMFTIEKGVPLPTTARGRRGLYPFEQMKVGDSFLVESANPTERVGIAQRLRSSVAHRKRRSGEHYTVALVEGGVRVWRIRNP